jgi:Tfp pilus assembly protein PilE
MFRNLFFPESSSTDRRNQPVGQQQFLLIVLGVIVVSIAVAIGITMFSDSSISTNRDAVVSDLQTLATRAQQFYHRPIFMGGGGNSFDLLTTGSILLLTTNPTDENGSFVIETAGSGSGPNAMVVIKGVGTELNNGAPVAAHVFVFPDRDSVATLN